MRSYGQHCALARALDHVGDRWTLLIVRELLVGPRRWTELRDGLPGIATNLLASRLRGLELDGLITTTDADADGSSYTLTTAGQELAEPVAALVRWGARYMGPRPGTDAFRPHWLVVTLRSLLGPDPGRPWNLVVEDVTVRVGETIEVVEKPDEAEPTLKTDGDTALGLVAHRLRLPQALASGRATVVRGRADDFAALA